MAESFFEHPILNSPYKYPGSLIALVQGYRNDKANAIRASWELGVKNLGNFGRWAFAEFTDVFEIEKAFGELVDSFVGAMERA